jgi:hypothetical protein
VNSIDFPLSQQTGAVSSVLACIDFRRLFARYFACMHRSTDLILPGYPE